MKELGSLLPGGTMGKNVVVGVELGAQGGGHRKQQR